MPPAHAQASNIIVSGGGQSTTVSSSDVFVLPGVTPSNQLILTFTVDGSDNARMNIGQVPKGSVVTVRNISIDTKSSSARPAEIEVKEPDIVEAEKELEEEKEIKYKVEKETEVESEEKKQEEEPEK